MIKLLFYRMRTMLEPKCITNLKSCLNHYNQDVVDLFWVDGDPDWNASDEIEVLSLEFCSIACEPCSNPCAYE